MKSAYITTALIGKGTGGGNVAYHESNALARVTELEILLSRNELTPKAYERLNNEFLYDYFALQLLREKEVDLAHFNGNPFGLTAKNLKDKGAKIVVTVPAHNLELSVEEFSRLGIQYPFVHMTDPFLWGLYTHHIKIADLIICPSLYSTKYLRRKLELQNEIKVIPHGTDVPSEIKPLPNTFTVAHISQFGPDKGQIYLLKAWKMLNLPAKLIIAGAGTEQLSSLTDSYNVSLLGYVEDVNKIYDECSVYVQPSVTEAFGIEVLEAMARGRAVIVSEGAGVHELIEDGKEGFIVPIRNPSAIADHIEYFFDNPDELKRMGSRAREKAKLYTWDRIEEMYEEAYLGLLNV